MHTDPYLDSKTGSICTTISKDVKDKNNKLLRVAAIDIILDNLFATMAEIEISENAKGYIVNADGLFITNEDSASLMKNQFLINMNLKSTTLTKTIF